MGIGALEEAYYEYILTALLDLIPYIGLFCVFLVFTGIYISDILLRPFKLIGDYCEKVLKGEPNVIYDPEFFTDLKLLAEFSEYFFIRALVQYDSYRKLVLTDMLTSFTLIPGTMIRLGYGLLHENLTSRNNQRLDKLDFGKYY